MTLSVIYTVVDGELMSENRNGVKSDYIPDPLGSTAALINAEHVITDTFSWWPYGELRSHVGSSVTPYGYTGTLGAYTDSPSNRIYETHRVLRPPTTVWQTVDRVWPREKAYAYVLANPCTVTDPSGAGGCQQHRLRFEENPRPWWVLEFPWHKHRYGEYGTHLAPRKPGCVPPPFPHPLGDGLSRCQVMCNAIKDGQNPSMITSLCAECCFEFHLPPNVGDPTPPVLPGGPPTSVSCLADCQTKLFGAPNVDPSGLPCEC